MSDQTNNSLVPPQSPFEQIKQIDPDGNEFWSARDLSQVLGYVRYAKFSGVLVRAQMACENSGQDSADHFYRAIKMVDIGSNAKREFEDMHLSRYACYLVIQNADPDKEIVALGQTYFAVQTRRQELADQADQPEFTEDDRRLVLRKKVTQQNTDLASVAKQAGVITPQDFGIFQNHGYKGLYNGLTAEDIHQRKGLKKSQKILDHMGATELAANLFRSTQAEEKLRRDNVQGKENANQVHHQAGLVVRHAIEELGGTMPEDLPSVDSIKKLERAEKKRLPAPKPKDVSD
jgi:DNA-damage-inducible protein D